jgi:hypothetical protein
MNFEISAHAPPFSSDAQDRIQKVGAGLQIPVAGMFHLNRFSVGSREINRAQARVSPEALKVAFSVREGMIGGGRFAHG